MFKTAFLVGHALLPQGMAAKSVYETLAITVEVELRHHVVVRADCTLATQHARDFVARMFIGAVLPDDLDRVIERLRETYSGAALQALVAAVRDLRREYFSFVERSARPAPSDALERG